MYISSVYPQYIPRVRHDRLPTAARVGLSDDLCDIFCFLAWAVYDTPTPPPLQYRDRHARIEQTRETWSKAGNDGTAPSEPPVCQYWSAISRQFGFTRSYCLWQCASHFLVGHTHTHTHTTQCLNHLQPRRMWCRLQCETDVIICIIHLTHLTDFEQSLIDFYFHFSI